MGFRIFLSYLHDIQVAVRQNNIVKMQLPRRKSLFWSMIDYIKAIFSEQVTLREDGFVL